MTGATKENGGNKKPPFSSKINVVSFCNGSKIDFFSIRKSDVKDHVNTKINELTQYSSITIQPYFLAVTYKTRNLLNKRKIYEFYISVFPLIGNN